MKPVQDKFGPRFFQHQTTTPFAWLSLFHRKQHIFWPGFVQRKLLHLWLCLLCPQRHWLRWKLGIPRVPTSLTSVIFHLFFFGHAGNIHSWNRDPGGCCLKTAAFLPFFFWFLCDVPADAIFDWGLPTLADEKARSGCKNFCENLCGSPLGRDFPPFVCGIGGFWNKGLFVENPRPFESFLFFFPKDVSSQGSSEDCWRISHHTYPTHISHHTYPTHISHHTYPTHISHHTYPTHIHHTTHIPHISIQNVSHQYVSHQYVSVQHVSHQYVSMLCVSIQKVCISRESQTYPTNTYPTNTYLQHVSHQYGSIQCVSIQKVCISRNGNEYEYHCISFHTIATRREW